MAANMNQKVVLVTGGTTDIGLACVKAFAIQGSHVVMTAKDADKASKVVNGFDALGFEVDFVQCDVTKAQEVAQLFEQVQSLYGRVDVALNHVGIEGVTGVKAADYDAKIFDEVVASTLKGSWLCMKHELQYMLGQSNGGVIVNIAGQGGLEPNVSDGCANHASQAGLIAMTQSTALEYQDTQIRVNVICRRVGDDVVGDVVKNSKAARKSSSKRSGHADAVANTVLWLTSDQAGFINGEMIRV